MVALGDAEEVDEPVPVCEVVVPVAVPVAVVAPVVVAETPEAVSVDLDAVDALEVADEAPDVSLAVD